MYNFKNYKNKKERGMTNQEFYESIKEEILASDNALVITVENNQITYSTTGGRSIEILGALNHVNYMFNYDTIEWVEE